MPEQFQEKLKDQAKQLTTIPTTLSSKKGLVPINTRRVIRLGASPKTQDQTRLTTNEKHNTKKIHHKHKPYKHIIAQHNKQTTFQQSPAVT